MEKKSSCYGCTERHEGCHSSCEKYKEFRKMIDAKNEEAHKKKKAFSDYHDVKNALSKNFKKTGIVSKDFFAYRW